MCVLLLLVCVHLQQEHKSPCFSVSYCAFCCVGAKTSSGSVCVALLLCVSPAESGLVLCYSLYSASYCAFCCVRTRNQQK